MSQFLSYLRNRYSIISRIFLFLLSVVILVLVFPKEGKFKYEFSKGKPWMHADLIAPFDFAILKSESELETERQEALQSVFPYFRHLDMKDSLINVLSKNFEEEWNKNYASNVFNNNKKEINRNLLLSVFDSVMQVGVVSMTNLKESPGKIYLITNQVVTEKHWNDLFTIRKVDQLLQSRFSGNRKIDEKLLTRVLRNVVVQNVVYDAETTRKERDEKLASISTTRGMVQQGERIISKGELVSGQSYQILESLRQDYESRLGSSFKYEGILGGQIILLSVTLASLLLFLMFFREEVFADTKQVILILLLILTMVVATSFVIKFNPAYIYLLPVCLIPIIVGVFTDSRLALFVHIITIILMGFLVPNSYEFVFLQIFAGIITILSTVKLERRSQFFFTSLMIFLTYSLIYTGITLIKEGSLHDLNYTNYVLFAGSALMTLFSYPVIFVFEKTLGLITNVTLLELSNTNNKLLRQLALNAPGTFQHSMQMANLAEEAIHEIGGNPLLVRTGAMYHDIGKMEDPLYFVENQSTGVNPHDELTNDESVEIIIDHVLRGVEMARKYNLPEQIIDFIRTHHGTRKAEYFFKMAQKDSPEEEIDEKAYTYPGPEPFSKETAVLMMADTVEAASRSLKKPDEESISELVERVIDGQIASKQFENSDITFRDVRKIKRVFKKKLMNIYHLRIEYPR